MLASGWDSIYLSFDARLEEGAIEWLTDLKAAAAANGDGEPIDLGVVKGIVQARGRGRYPYLIECPGFDVQVTSSDRLPAIYCRLRSEFLHSEGVEAASGSVARIAAYLLANVDQPVVSRGDLYSDFVGWIPQEADLGRFVTRSRRRGEFFDEAEGHFERRQFTGFRFGRGELLARLYDKTREIKHSGKMWLWDLWGLDSGRAVVWRLEFQFRRQALHDFGLSMLTEVLASERDLWTYATGWLSLRNPSANRQPYRWPVADEWAVLACSRNSYPAQGLVRGRVREQKEQYLLTGLGGLITSWAAMHGIASETLAFQRASTRLAEHFAERGVSFGEIVRRKAARMMEL